MGPASKRLGSIAVFGGILLFAIALLGGFVFYFHNQEAVPLSEGVYQLCSEVSGFSGETLELKGGRFRYWFYSDAGGGGKCPLSGTYSVRGSRLILDDPELRNHERTIGILNGVNVLWRKDGLRVWQKEKGIQPYAVLIQNPLPIEANSPPKPPSVELIYTDEMRILRQKRYEQRFIDQPPEVQVLLRARCRSGDRNMDTYKREAERARAQPDAKVLGQLVGLLGRDAKHSIEAKMILDDLFGATFLFEEPPPFLKEETSRKKGLEALIDALSSAHDRSALEETLMVFLHTSGVGKIDLAVPGTGLRIVLEAGPNGGGRYASEDTGNLEVDWRSIMSKLIPACQKWMREQLRK
jgi:hypothetical protein